MRFFLSFILIIFCWPSQSNADTEIQNQLQAIAKSIRAAELQSDKIQSEIERLNNDKTQLLQQLRTTQYDIARQSSALHKLKSSPKRLSFLLPELSYLDYHYRLRAYQTRKNILTNRMLDNYTVFTTIEDKQSAILNYIDERNRLSATVDSLIMNVHALNENREDVETAVKTLSDKNISLNQFISTLIDIPYPYKSSDHLVFLPPASGVMRINNNEMSIITAPGALITAPADGIIAYADNFGNLGNIVIIRHGQGYISILHNIGEIMVKQGLFVTSGEPIATANTNNIWEKDGNTSMFYYLLRYNEQSINPMTKFSGL